jgi:GNAT superfamily N-acetyltransferase
MHETTNPVRSNLKFKPLAVDNWNQFEELMGDKGGCGGCWCMSFRLTSREFSENKYQNNKGLMYDLVKSCRPTGLIATYKGQAVGWIAFAPREDYKRIERSKAFKRPDDKPVWSITCFFIKKEFRKMGLSEEMIKGVIEYAKKNNIHSLEAYPAIPYADNVPPPFLWVGILSAFARNGFHVVRQNGKSRVMVRLELHG